MSDAFANNRVSGSSRKSKGNFFKPSKQMKMETQHAKTCGTQPKQY
jgi:hypothetical protein